MDTFVTELSEAVNDLDGRNPSCKPPSPTTDKVLDKDIEADATPSTQIEGMSSMSVRLERLSHFRIHTDAIYFTSSEPHGRGGKAEVVKATLKRGNGSDEQEVAVKKLRCHGDINERKFGNEFVQEVDVMARLSHKNIVNLIGFVEELEAGKAWIVLSWEPNGNVSEFLATGEWEIPERISLIKDTFAGIEYLHTRQPPICHGDLKSLNILVSAECRAMITDFGSARILREREDRGEAKGEVLAAMGASVIAKATDEQTNQTQITIVTSTNQLTLTGPAWSLRWAAPEVAWGELQSLASDIWAAGWVCWEVMTNKVPFPELNSEGAIVLKVVDGHVPAVREDTQLSQVVSLCSLMTDCWAFDPGNRPTIGQCNRQVEWMPSVIPSGKNAPGSNIPSARLLCEMARVHRSQGNLKEAISLAQQSLSAATLAGDENTKAEASLELGGLCYLASKYTEAEQYYTQAQEISTRIGDESGKAKAFHGIGRLYRFQSKLTQAEESYIRARNILSRLGDLQGQANISRALGIIRFDRSQYHEAEELYNQAIDIYARIGNDQGHGDTLLRLGELFIAQSEYAKAEGSFNRALEKYSRIGNDLGRANIIWYLGHLYRMQGLNTKGAPFLAEARGLFSLLEATLAGIDSTSPLLVAAVLRVAGTEQSGFSLSLAALDLIEALFDLMETFATELLQSLHNLDNRSRLCEPPLPTIDGNAEKEIEKKRLGSLAYLRMRASDIEFTPSDGQKHGGKAEVVKATLKRVGGTDLQVAVKKLRYGDDVSKRKFCNEFVHEVDTMAQLLHRNIARLIGFVEDVEEGKAWVVMCWEPNGNLSEFLATGEWEIPERISLIQDTFAGIEYLHTRRPPICHGDLKSLNILVSAKYQAIITDFGSARILKEAEDRGETKGAVLDAAGASAIAQATDELTDRTEITIVTSSNQLTLTGPAWSLRWASPEVALGEPQSLASDIWAAGWICWEVMTSKLPFPELNSEGAIVLKVVEGHVPAVREDTQLSQIVSLCSLMTDCWAFDPQNRPNISQCKREVQWMPSVFPSGKNASGSNIPSARLLCEMARVHRSRSSFKEALPLFEQALSVATSSGDEKTRASVSYELGLVSWMTSKYAEAEQYYGQARDIYTRIGDRLGQARALHAMGQTYHQQSNLTQAEDCYTRARNIFSQLGDLPGQAAGARVLGNIYSERRQYHEAEELYKQAIDIFVRVGDGLGHGDTLMRLGELFSTQSEYARAEELFYRALEKFGRVGHKMGRANVIKDLGHLYRDQGLNTRAAPLLAEAKDLYALIGDSDLEEDCSYWLAVVSTGEDSSTASLSVPGDDDVSSPAHQG